MTTAEIPNINADKITEGTIRNITGYDSPTLYTPNDQRRLKGKMNVSYDDRQGLYKLEATNITKTDNVTVLRYKVGDKISIRNTSENAKDFFVYQ